MLEGPRRQRLAKEVGRHGLRTRTHARPPTASSGRATSTCCRRCCWSSPSCSRCSWWRSSMSARKSPARTRALKRLTRQIAEITNLLEPREGQGQIPRGRTRQPAGLARHAQSRQRPPGRRSPAGGADKDARIAGAQQGAERARRPFPPRRSPSVDVLNQQLLALRRQTGARCRRRWAPPKPRTRRARPAFPTSAPASTSPSPARCRSCSATGPTSSAACVSC